MIECSVNELDALARRAARGTGMTWGMAEEVGKAARWLAARKLPGIGLLAHLLQDNDGVSYDELVPVIDGPRWRGRSRRLCPIVTGVALSDAVDEITAEAPITLASVAYPVLLSAYLGRAAKATGRGLEIHWPGVTIRCLPNGPCVEAKERDSLTTDRAADVVVRAANGNGAPIEPRPATVRVAPEEWALLKKFAARTYVPASEESRLLGAGPGADDST